LVYLGVSVSFGVSVLGRTSKMRTMHVRKWFSTCLQKHFHDQFSFCLCGSV